MVSSMGPEFVVETKFKNFKNIEDKFKGFTFPAEQGGGGGGG